MSDKLIDCTRCWGSGWIGYDCHCPDCDGTGQTEEDPFYVEADLLYERLKDDEVFENR